MSLFSLVYVNKKRTDITVTDYGLTDLSLMAFLRDMGKQRGVPSGTILFAWRNVCFVQSILLI